MGTIVHLRKFVRHQNYLMLAIGPVCLFLMGLFVSLWAFGQTLEAICVLFVSSIGLYTYIHLVVCKYLLCLV